jgi:hypothetical protein
MAEIELQATLNGEYMTRIFDGFNGCAGINIVMQPEGGSDWTWMYAPKQGGETDKDYAERIVREMIRAIVRCSEYSEDVVRHSEDVNDITPPSQDVPDEIVT